MISQMDKFPSQRAAICHKLNDIDYFYFYIIYIYMPTNIFDMILLLNIKLC